MSTDPTLTPEHVTGLLQRLDAMDRHLDYRLAEIRARQEEEITLLKALSCQLRSRVERVERRTARPGG